jgi:hypothetical protein
MSSCLAAGLGNIQECILGVSPEQSMTQDGRIIFCAKGLPLSAQQQVCSYIAAQFEIIVLIVRPWIGPALAPFLPSSLPLPFTF